MEIEGLVCTQVLVGTPSSDFSEKRNETQSIYSGSVLLDLHPLPWQNQVKDLINSLKYPSESKTTFTCNLQGELTQAQSLTNPKSYQTLAQRKDRNEKYIMITNWSDYTSFSSLQITSLKNRENMFLKFLRERDYDLIDFRF